MEPHDSVNGATKPPSTDGTTRSADGTTGLPSQNRVLFLLFRCCRVYRFTTTNNNDKSNNTLTLILCPVICRIQTSAMTDKFMDNFHTLYFFIQCYCILCVQKKKGTKERDNGHNLVYQQVAMSTAMCVGGCVCERSSCVCMRKSITMMMCVSAHIHIYSDECGRAQKHIGHLIELQKLTNGNFKANSHRI